MFKPATSTCSLLASSASTASTQAGSGAAERVERLALRLAAAAFLRDAVGMNTPSSSCDDWEESESVGEARVLVDEVHEGAMLEVERLRLGTVGICNSGLFGELRAESGVSLPALVPALDGELARSSESSREAGEMGVIGRRAKRSSGAMQVGC